MAELARRARLWDRETAAALLTLLVVTAIGYGFVCEPGKIPYSPHSDAVTYALGSKDTLYRSVSQHHSLPLWQPSQLSGGPALTNPQATYLQPLHALFILLPPATALGPTYALCFFLAAVIFFALARTLGLAVLPSLLVGVAGLFNGKLLLAAFAGWLPILPSIVLSPLLVLTVVRLARAPQLGTALAFAAASALCLHCGHLQIVYYTTLGCVVYVAVVTVGLVRKDQLRALGRLCAALVLGSSLALALSCYLVWPIVAELPLTSRSRSTYEFFLSGHATTLAHLATLLSPDALGTPLDGSYPPIELWEDSAYFGLLPLLLAVLGALRSHRRSLARGLSVTFVLSVLLAMDTPLLRLSFFVVPGMRLFHCPSRLLFISSFAGIALCGLGAETLLSAVSSARARAGLTLALLAAMTLQGSLHARRYLTMLPSEAVLPTPTPAYAQAIARDRALYRVAPVGRDTINYGWASSFGLSLVTGYDPYNLRAYGQYMDFVAHGQVGPDGPRAWVDLETVARPDLLRTLNVKYLVTQRPARFADGAFELLGAFTDQPVFTFYEGLRSGPLYVYRHRRPLGRAFFVDRVIAARDEAAMLKAMSSQSLDGLAVAMTSETADLAAHGDPSDRVTVTANSPGRLSLAVRATTRRFLVISEVWHPGWQARLDGRPLSLARTDYTLLGAVIPSGEHRVELVFEPLHWKHARTVSFAALALAGVLVLAGALARLRADTDRRC